MLLKNGEVHNQELSASFSTPATFALRIGARPGARVILLDLVASGGAISIISAARTSATINETGSQTCREGPISRTLFPLGLDGRGARRRLGDNDLAVPG